MHSLTATPAVVTLSREELLYLMQMLKIPALPGFSVPAQPETPDDLQIAVMAGTERALRARGFLRVEDSRATVESALLGILGFCARPARGLMLTCAKTGGAPLSAIYLLSDDLRVKHASGDGLHSFALMESDRAVVDDVLALLNLASAPGGEVEAWEFEITGRDLLAAALTRLNTAESGEATLTALLNRGAREDEVRQLVQIMHHDALASAFVGVWPGDEPGFGIIETAAAWWLLLPLGRAGNSVRYCVRAADSGTVRDQVFRLAQRVLRV